MVTITTTGHCDSMAMAMVTSGDEKAKSTPGVEGDRQEKSSRGAFQGETMGQADKMLRFNHFPQTIGWILCG